MHADLRYVATDEERAAVYRLRYELYVEDQGLFTDEADHERRWLTDQHDADSSIVIAEVDGELVGTIRLTWGGAATFSDATRKAYGTRRFEGVVDERDIILVSRLLVRPELRGGPLGCQLFQKAFELAAEHNAELILGTCEIHLVNHYRKLGFRPFGALYNHPTNGVLVPIVAVTGDFEYLRRVGAVTLDTLRQRTRPMLCLEQILARVDESCVVSQEQEDSEQYRREISREIAGTDGRLGGIMRGLSRDETITLLARSHILTCAAGDALVLEGHVSRTPYVLLSGALDVRYGGRETRVEERGAAVGEVAMLSSHPRMSDIVAGPQGARVLVLSYGNLRRIFASNSSLAAKLLHFLALGLCEKLAERAGSEHKLRQRPAPRSASLVPKRSASKRRTRFGEARRGRPLQRSTRLPRRFASG